MTTPSNHDDEELQRLYIPLDYLGVPKTPTFWQRLWMRIRYGIRFRKLKVPHTSAGDLLDYTPQPVLEIKHEETATLRGARPISQEGQETP